MRLFINPIPCIPFPFEGEGEDRERGATAPLRRLRYGFGGKQSRKPLDSTNEYQRDEPQVS